MGHCIIIIIIIISSSSSSSSSSTPCLSSSHLCSAWRGSCTPRQQQMHLLSLQVLEQSELVMQPSRWQKNLSSPIGRVQQSKGRKRQQQRQQQQE